MRRGFVLGFILGSGIASVVKASDAEAPGVDGEAMERKATGLIGQAKAWLNEALAEGKRASDEKETELEREFEQAIRRRPAEWPRTLGR